MIGSFGAGMGISTWWYRGSDAETERALEKKAGRKLTELSLNSNSAFQASDANACSVYVLCTIVRRLAQLTQDRVN
jgi:hypothetical protein